MASKKTPSQFAEIALRGFVWAFVGLIFGSLFTLFVEWLASDIATPTATLLAVVGASALTSLLYGSMRLTVMVANFTFIAMLVYTWLGPSTLDLQPLVFIGAGVGVAVGAAYGLKDKGSRVFCAEAKIIAGAVAGLLVGAFAVGMRQLFPELSNHFLAMIVAAPGVLAYIALSGWFIARCHHLLPPFIDGAVVGVGVGTVTGLVFVIMAGTLDETLLSNDLTRSFVDRVEASWGITALLCALACMPIGILRAVLRVPWYDR